MRNFNKAIKNICIASVLLSVMLVSCKKDNKQSNITNGKLQKVTFVVNGFTQTHSGVTANKLHAGSLSTNSVTDTIPTYPVLYYQVFDTYGNIVHQIIQDTTTVHFGTITDQLLPGNYTIVMIVGIGQANSKLTLSSNGAPNGRVTSIFDDNMDYGGNFFYDTFYKKLSFTATSGTSSQNVTLQRIVGQLFVNIQDAIPANVAEIDLKGDSLIGTGEVATGLPSLYDIGGTSVKPFNTVAPGGFTIGETNYKMSVYIYNTIAPFSVTINAYAHNSVNGKNDILVASKKISNIRCAVNQQVTLTGNLFGGTSAGSTGSTTNVKVDSTWNTTILNYHF